MPPSLGRAVFRQAKISSSRTQTPLSCAARRHIHFTPTSRHMASPQTTAGEVISETAKAEGGPYKGSAAAEMQSQVSKVQNFEQAVDEVGGKMQADPASVTSEDAAYLKSREARATNIANPPSDSISAQAERLAAVNEGATKLPSKANLDPAEQSTVDRLENFEQAAEYIAPKMANRPDKVTPEDAAYLQSREQRAFGEESRGGIASQAKSMADQNVKKGNV